MKYKEKKMKFNIIDIFVTMFLTLFLCIFWVILELLFYSKIESRIVDNIIVLIVIPFIYFSVKNEKQCFIDKVKKFFIK